MKQLYKTAGEVAAALADEGQGVTVRMIALRMRELGHSCSELTARTGLYRACFSEWDKAFEECRPERYRIRGGGRGRKLVLEVVER